MIRPIIPGHAVDTRQALIAPTVRRPLPLPAIPAAPARRTTDTVYQTVSIDDRGRFTHRALLDILGWTSRTRLITGVQNGRLAFRHSADGANIITIHGRVAIPRQLRLAVNLRPLDRVLLAADPERHQLVVVPAAVLDRLLADGDAE